MKTSACSAPWSAARRLAMSRCSASGSRIASEASPVLLSGSGGPLSLEFQRRSGEAEGVLADRLQATVVVGRHDGPRCGVAIPALERKPLEDATATAQPNAPIGDGFRRLGAEVF